MRIIIISFVLLIVSISVNGQDQKESLRGLKGIYVKVLPVAEDARKDGLDSDKLQQIVVAQLRKANVNVYTEPQASEGDANLIIIIETIKHPQGIYLFTVSINLIQNVRLTRLSEQKVFMSETWSRNVLGLTTPKRMEIIQEPLKEKVGEFISDFVSVNQKLN